ncbi:phosphoserine phosphatase [Campylobacter iguaniorum]|uniref:Phosphoserine phosphatase n=1 Tax=Campylobacter iguaniorum TaxID=1244531 RepID=A0A076F943_9BACT|nr:phosphoserine phosphatase SerB [Campylobacter iguaniorum]AII14218.1 phosphoserine phosphatase [Campylobacter iguaniorum]ALV23957.1 phosphoserine phosphatase [Campylobacter iguaniorum]ANE35380.1 phosphoserine phosphatase [Campylobacter iguaniorum]
MIKLCVFDFDSTLMDGETITILSKALGKDKEVSEITKRAMAGELDFYESLVKRVRLIEGLPLSDAMEVARNLTFIEGAKDIITYLKAKGIKTVVFSGGFHIATDPAQEKLGYDLNFSNELHHKNGILTGHVGGEMMFGDSKGKMLARLKSFLNLKDEEIACVGDGANDVSMFKEAGTGIAFCANEILKKAATHIIDTKDLREIKQIL